MTTSNAAIERHIAQLRLESVLIAGEQRKGCCVPGPHHPMFIATVDIWSVCHIPSGRELVRGLTQREAFERAINLLDGGRSAGLVMSEPLRGQLAALTSEQRNAMQPAARAYVEALEQLLAGS
jgi:hypothetical protein